MGLGGRTKTEHAGAKNGGGYYGPRADAKKVSNRLRRQEDKRSVRGVAKWKGI